MTNIVIDIYPDGNVKIDVEGHKGNTCQEITKQIEVVLGGGAVKKRDNKPEFYAPVGNYQESKITW